MITISPHKNRKGYWYVRPECGSGELYPFNCIIHDRIDFRIPANVKKRNQLLRELREYEKNLSADLRRCKRIPGFDPNDIQRTEDDIAYILRLIGKISILNNERGLFEQ